MEITTLKNYWTDFPGFSLQFLFLSFFVIFSKYKTFKILNNSVIGFEFERRDVILTFLIQIGQKLPLIFSKFSVIWSKMDFRRHF